MNEKKIMTLVDSENLKTIKSPRFCIFLIVLSLFLSIICSGCIFANHDPKEPPEYLFKDTLNEFETFLEADPDIIQHRILVTRYSTGD